MPLKDARSSCDRRLDGLHVSDRVPQILSHGALSHASHASGVIKHGKSMNIFHQLGDFPLEPPFFGDV